MSLTFQKIDLNEYRRFDANNKIKEIVNTPSHTISLKNYNMQDCNDNGLTNAFLKGKTWAYFFELINRSNEKDITIYYEIMPSYINIYDDSLIDMTAINLDIMAKRLNIKE